MMVVILNILIEIIFAGLWFYVGYRVGRNRGYEKGRRDESEYWYRIHWEVDRYGHIHRKVVRNDKDND